METIDCPDCGKPLQPVWRGVLACFCIWGGKEPTVDEIVQAVDAEKKEWQ